MMHLSEEELIEQYYSKGKSAPRIRRHIETCAQCAQAYASLQRDIAAFPAVQPPVRDASYGERLWQSIAPALPRYESSKRSWPRRSPWRVLVYSSAAVLMIAGAFFAGRQWEHRQPPAAASNPLAHPQPVQPLVLVILSDHLDRSERLLIELKHADAGSAGTLYPLRDEARDLLISNRVCRQDTRTNNDPALAAALDHLDRLLRELNSQPGGLNAASLTRLQNQMKADDLLFEVRVLRSRFPEQQTAKSSGGSI
ncbi:MAG: hypothetical protein ABSD72_08525 [Terracidiphilus sp.]|jgi:hypothetical protein